MAALERLRRTADGPRRLRRSLAARTAALRAAARPVPVGGTFPLPDTLFGAELLDLVSARLAAHLKFWEGEPDLDLAPGRRRAWPETRDERGNGAPRPGSRPRPARERRLAPPAAAEPRMDEPPPPGDEEGTPRPPGRDPFPPLPGWGRDEGGERQWVLAGAGPRAEIGLGDPRESAVRRGPGRAPSPLDARIRTYLALGGSAVPASATARTPHEAPRTGGPSRAAPGEPPFAVSRPPLHSDPGGRDAAPRRRAAVSPHPSEARAGSRRDRRDPGQPAVQNVYNVSLGGGASPEDDDLAERLAALLSDQARRHGVPLT